MSSAAAADLVCPRWKMRLAWSPGGARACSRNPRRARAASRSSIDQPADLLDQLRGVFRLMAELLYGSGLRLRECRDLRRRQHEHDLRRGAGWVALPEGLTR